MRNLDIYEERLNLKDAIEKVSNELNQHNINIEDINSEKLNMFIRQYFKGEFQDDLINNSNYYIFKYYFANSNKKITSNLNNTKYPFGYDSSYKSREFHNLLSNLNNFDSIIKRSDCDLETQNRLYQRYKKLDINKIINCLYDIRFYEVDEHSYTINNGPLLDEIYKTQSYSHTERELNNSLTLLEKLSTSNIIEEYLKEAKVLNNNTVLNILKNDNLNKFYTKYKDSIKQEEFAFQEKFYLTLVHLEECNIKVEFINNLYSLLKQDYSSRDIININALCNENPQILKYIKPYMSNMQRKIIAYILNETNIEDKDNWINKIIQPSTAILFEVDACRGETDKIKRIIKYVIETNDTAILEKLTDINTLNVIVEIKSRGGDATIFEKYQNEFTSTFCEWNEHTKDLEFSLFVSKKLYNYGKQNYINLDKYKNIDLCDEKIKNDIYKIFNDNPNVESEFLFDYLSSINDINGIINIQQSNFIKYKGESSKLLEQIKDELHYTNNYNFNIKIYEMINTPLNNLGYACKNNAKELNKYERQLILTVNNLKHYSELYDDLKDSQRKIIEEKIKDFKDVSIIAKGDSTQKINKLFKNQEKEYQE